MKRVKYSQVPNYSQQDATFFGLFTFTDVLHVSGGSSAHHQDQQYWLTTPEAVCTVVCS
jgi:hypothetical protein